MCGWNSSPRIPTRRILSVGGVLLGSHAWADASPSRPMPNARRRAPSSPEAPAEPDGADHNALRTLANLVRP